MTDDDSGGRSDRSNPIGTMLGATFGPFGAAVGSVVSEDRFALKLSVGTNADDGFDEASATTVEIEESEEDLTDDAEAGEEDGETEEETDTEETAEATDSDESAE